MQNKNTKTLKAKLIIRVTLILAMTFTVVGGLVYYGLNKLSTSFLTLSAKNSEKIKSDLQVFSDNSTERIKSNYLDALKTKGANMVKKDASSLVSAFEDNSFSMVREFVKKTFKDDEEIVHASFFVAEEDEIKAWQYISRSYPEGMDIPFSYNIGKKTWSGTYKGKGKVSVKDPALVKHLKTNSLTAEIVQMEINGKDETVYEVIVPVFRNMEPKALEAAAKAAREDEEPIAYLRYVLSLEKMRVAIAEERKNLEKYLGDLEEQNALAANETKETGARLLSETLLLLVFSAIALFVISFFFINFVSNKIANPVKALIGVANRISGGEYKQQIDIESDDEIGILADSFQSMCNAIVKRDEELEALNKGLEDQVKERTAQLATEMEKVRNLLDSMRQSVFTIDSTGSVVAPVSRFSQEIFGKDIEGAKVMETLYSDISEKSELGANLKTTLSSVFGEDDLQWMLLEENLPSRVVKNEDQDNEQVLRVSYNPIYDQYDQLDQIMYVVEDVTDLEKLERQIAKERAEGAERNEILQELASCNLNDLKGFLRSTGELFVQVSESFESKEKLFEDRAVSFRNLHTIKGNSKVFGFHRLGTIIHDVETVVNDLRGYDKDMLTDELFSELTSKFAASVGVFQKYTSFAEGILNIPNDFKNESVAEIHGFLIKNHNFDHENGAKYVPVLRSIGSAEVIESLAHPQTANQAVQAFVKDAFLESADFIPFSRNFSELMDFYKAATGGEDLVVQDSEWVAHQAQLTSEERARLYDFICLVELNVKTDFKDVKAAMMSHKPASHWDANPLLREVAPMMKSGDPRFARLSEAIAACEGWSYIESWLMNLKLKSMGCTPDQAFEALKNYRTESTTFNGWVDLLLESFSNKKYFLLTMLADLADAYVTNEQTLQKANYPSQTVYVKNVEELRAHVVEVAGAGEKTQHLFEQLNSIPLKVSFARYFPMVREVSHTIGKSIKFMVKGEEVFASENVVSEVNGALTHMIRNSIDHGIEKPEIRTKSGKPEHGTICFEISDNEDEVVIKATDDGAGIDPNIIKKKAVEKGIFSEAEVSKMSDEDAIQIIYMSEFSTKDDVSDLSGRGVGMDAVKATVELLGGNLETISKVGKGSEFTIRIPKVQSVKKIPLKDVSKKVA